MNKKIGAVLVVGAVDPTGFAGISQDIRTLASIGILASPVITALTAQNSIKKPKLLPTEIRHFKEQLLSVLDGVKISSIKTGAMTTAQHIKATIDFYKNLKNVPLVVDPVIYSSNNGTLLPKKALSALKTLISLSTVTTPNISELYYLTNIKATNKHLIKQAAAKLCEAGCANVVITGGHVKKGFIIDYLFTKNSDFFEFAHQKIQTKNTRGTGCRFASALSGFLAMDYPIEKAFLKTCDLMQSSIEKSTHLAISKGAGPVL